MKYLITLEQSINSNSKVANLCLMAYRGGALTQKVSLPMTTFIVMRIQYLVLGHLCDRRVN